MYSSEFNQVKSIANIVTSVDTQSTEQNSTIGRCLYQQQRLLGMKLFYMTKEVQDLIATLLIQEKVFPQIFSIARSIHISKINNSLLSLQERKQLKTSRQQGKLVPNLASRPSWSNSILFVKTSIVPPLVRYCMLIYRTTKKTNCALL